MVWGFFFVPGLIMFVLTSLFGVLCVVVSSGLLGMWLGLELSFFGFLPILNDKTVGENEAACKYFVVQAVGSGLMLVSFVLVSGAWHVGLDYLILGEYSTFVLVLGFMMKLGIFPLHFWFPSVMSSSSWFSCFWLSVIQKVGPFWGVSGLGMGGWMMYSFVVMVVLTSIVGSFGGLAQVQFRPLLAYSSLGQTGWLGLIALAGLEFFFLYFFVYGVILGGLLCSLYMVNCYSVVDLPSWSYGGGLMYWVFSGGFFLSLSGLPPLVGSGLKLLGILVISSCYLFPLVFLIGSSMVSLYFYLNMFIGGLVGVGGCGYVSYSSLMSGGWSFLIVSFIMIINWLGGLPLFILMFGLMS